MLRPDVHFRDILLRTPLHYAALNGDLSIVSFLLSHGAVWNAQDMNGITVGECALEGGHKDIYNEVMCSLLVFLTSPDDQCWLPC